MWKTYWDNATERLKASKILLEHEMFNGAYEDAFMAIEIALKTWVVKYNPGLGPLKSPGEAKALGYRAGVIAAFFKHSLLGILDAYPVLDRELRAGAPEVHNLLVQLGVDADCWKPWQRYQGKASQKSVETYINIAEGLQKWMLDQLFPK
jgi:hypothetical protein